MNVELIQIAYYLGFTVLGWWLRHKGIALPSSPTPTPIPTNPATPAAPTSPDQRVLIDFLKSLLDRLAPPSAPATPPVTGNVVHVPIEVAANVKQPQV
jgi:hypothetical protein